MPPQPGIRRNFLSEEGVDPAVAAALGDFEQRDKMAALPAPTRAKVKRDKARKGKRLGMVDLPPELAAATRALAEQESVSQSNLMAFALTRLLAQVQRGEVVLQDYKEPARSLQFDYRLRLDPSTGSTIAKGKSER